MMNLTGPSDILRGTAMAVTNHDTGDNAWMMTSTVLVLLMTPALGFFYGGLVAMRFTRGYHGRSAARMSIWSFAVAAFTLFGATLLGTGVHHS